jgi:hypothetical protein
MIGLADARAENRRVDMTEPETQTCMECGEPTARSEGDSLVCKECG